jgi:hypothetical protein
MNSEQILTILSPAVQNFNAQFARDGELVRSKAEAHGVDVNYGDSFSVIHGPRWGKHSPDYQPRIPEIEEKKILRLAAAQRVVFMCEERRKGHLLSKHLGINTKNDAVIATAGSVAQPEKKRFKAQLDLVFALHEAAPHMMMEFWIHTGQCGGVDHFMGGYVSANIEQSGGHDSTWEQGLMFQLLNQFYSSTIQRVPSKQISMGVVHIKQEKVIGFQRV